MFEPIIGLSAGTLIGGISLVIAVMAAGGGHGTYMPAKILFPYTMLSTITMERITSPYVLLAILQFPLYGLFLGFTLSRGSRLFWTTACLLSVLHLGAFAIAWAYVPGSFS
jgi:hypothetical protein